MNKEYLQVIKVSSIALGAAILMVVTFNWVERKKRGGDDSLPSRCFLCIENLRQ